jgi:hypothetical protein
MTNITEAEKRRLFSLFENMKGEAVTTGLNRHANSDILLVDGL